MASNAATANVSLNFETIIGSSLKLLSLMQLSAKALTGFPAKD
jgi:hypothetical protein